MIRSPLMTVMVDAVMKAAKGLRRDFGEIENLQVSRKGPGDFVSQADFKAEKILREQLERARPDYGFVLEEGGIVEGKDPAHRWHVDPLDGTLNFLHGIPHWCVSVGPGPRSGAGGSRSGRPSRGPTRCRPVAPVRSKEPSWRPAPGHCA